MTRSNLPDAEGEKPDVWKAVGDLAYQLVAKAVLNQREGEKHGRDN